VNTTVHGGVPVKIVESTLYPFREEIALTVTPAEDVAFPLLLRIPGWATSGVDITINGIKQTYQSDALPRPNTFHRIARTWKPGDVVHMTFDMTVRSTRWFNDSIALERGPLVFSLEIGEDWRKLTTGMKNPARPPAAVWEVHPTTPWNYALAIDPEKLTQSVKVVRPDAGAKEPHHFSRQQNPIELRVGARRVEGWQMFEGSADAPPQSPVTTSGPIESIKLIPYGTAKLRITAFPVTKP
jgi:hypothetical protein